MKKRLEFKEELQKALAFLDKLDKKKNKSGRLHSELIKVKRDKRGVIVKWTYHWSVSYREKHGKSKS